MADRVRVELLHSWRAYERHAWGDDELQPLSRSGRNWHAESLLMTPVDTLDTLLMMGLDEEADAARELIAARLRFDHDIRVKNFEITIRILGGLLAAYEMTGDPALLEHAHDLGLRLLPAFESPTGMPYMYVNLSTGEVSGAVSNPAEIGTLIVELGTLSRHTGNPIFFHKAKRALVALYERSSPIGLVGEQINVETGEWVSRSSHVGGGIDSYYEYLLKCAVLFDDSDCKAMWRRSVRALDEHLAEEVASGRWYGEVDMETGERLRPEFGALHAFLPGVLALGGELENAEALQRSCFAMWNAHDVEPEVFDYRAMEVVNGRYPLRPEIIESAYYLHHFTGDDRYLDMGRTFFEDLVACCRTEDGYTVLEDVVTGEKGDLMPSYFLAETLKYLYLLFEPDPPVDLDEVVFNTEAHPFGR